MPPGRYQVHYKPITIPQPSGGDVEVEVKVWEYEEGSPGWELRRVIAGMGYGGRYLDEIGCFVKMAHEKLREAWGDDLDFRGEHVVPSRKSLAAQGIAAAVCFQDVREGWQVSSLGIVMLLVGLDRFRCGHGMHQNCVFWRAWCSSFIPIGAAVEKRMTAEQFQRCGILSSGENCCPHWEEVFHAMFFK